MLKSTYEGILDANFRINEAAEDGVLVMLDAGNPGFVKTSDGTAVYGVLAEKVKVYEKGEYRSPVKPIAGVGDKVGVYHSFGVYATDMFVDGAYTPGEDLYAANDADAGYITNTAPLENPVKIGQAIKVENGDLVFKLAV